MANGQQGGGGGGAGYAAMIPQLVGAGLQIATARPTRQERQQRRIAMGAPDPAVEALRRRLATQQLQTAMAAAAAQPGINPALALRQAQAGLAQSEIGTAAQLAAQQARSVEQARASDPLGRRRDAALSGVGGMLNILGTGLATQAAGRRNAEMDAAAARKSAMIGQAPVAETGMAAPGGVQVTPPAGAETTVALPPTVEPTVEPSAAPTEVQTTEEAAAAAPSATGVEDLGALERRGAPGPMAEGAAPTERTVVVPGPGEPGFSEAAFDQGAMVFTPEETMGPGPGQPGFDAAAFDQGAMVFTPEEIAAAEQQAIADAAGIIGGEAAAQLGAGFGGRPVVQPSIVQQPQMGQPVVTGTPGAMRPGTTMGSGEPLGLTSRRMTAPQPTMAAPSWETGAYGEFPGTVPSMADEAEARMRAGLGTVQAPRITTPQMEPAAPVAPTAPGAMRPGATMGSGEQFGARPQAMSEGQVRERRIQQLRTSLPPRIVSDSRNDALIESLADAEALGDPTLVQMIRGLIEAEASL